MSSAGPQSVIVVGAGALVGACAGALRATASREVQAIALRRIDGGGFDLGPLSDYPAERWRAFAAVGPDLLNLLRLGLMADLRSAGYRLAGIVSGRAVVPEGWRAGENSFIGEGAIVGTGCTMRHNVIVGAGSVIGCDTRIGHSVWIAPGTIVGAGVTIGDGTSIGSGAILADGAQIGRQCELFVAREYRGTVPARTFYSGMFDTAARIHRRSASEDANDRSADSQGTR